MSTPNRVLHTAPGSGCVSAWIRDRLPWLLALVAVAAIAAASALVTVPARMASDPPSKADGDEAPDVAPERSTERALLIDHSVVESKSLLDEPDMTGASIGTYAP